MSLWDRILIIWIVVTTVPVLCLLAVGILRIWFARLTGPERNPEDSPPATEILIPLKGLFAGQEDVLRSMLEQQHPNFTVIFILESEKDPADTLVEAFCRQYPHARKIIAGRSELCGQKNHNLIQGVEGLGPETEIIVFCDGSNAADPDWLIRFTRPIYSGSEEAVTTFRAFDPRPPNLAGVCQAIYASFILALDSVKAKPWGGATAIRRETFEQLKIREAWSRTVVDDLVLGNVLERAGVRIKMNPELILKSPLLGQTVKGLLAYLDRQILFPQFTNPFIWAGLLVMHTSLTLVVVASVVAGSLYPFGVVDASTATVSYLAVGCSLLAVLGLRSINPFSVSVGRWLVGFLPCMVLAGFVFIRSIFLNYIDWHGKRYWCGRDGVVLRSGPV